MKQINDLHIKAYRPLISPKELINEFKVSDSVRTTVSESREIVSNIINQKDKRMLFVTGPCSIHDVDSAMEYAEKLNELRKKVEDKIYLIMRVYFEKPRTTVGWRGLIVDPHLDGSYDIDAGLKIARKLLIDFSSLGMPTGSEMLDPILPQYIADLLSWAAIGARTSESQSHRDMASGLSMPVGFKNGTFGSLDIAINAIQAAKAEKSFLGIDPSGRTCVMSTSGNPDAHIILRGGQNGPNYHEEDIEAAESLLSKANLVPSVIVDCSHQNSGKKHSKQGRVLKSIIEQRENGNESLVGLMLESHLKEGSQSIPGNLCDLKYGQSITDECIGWEKTEELINFAYKKL